MNYVIILLVLLAFHFHSIEFIPISSLCTSHLPTSLYFLSAKQSSELISCSEVAWLIHYFSSSEYPVYIWDTCFPKSY